MMSSPTRILLTDVTGYIGGPLLPLLEQRGVCVRCLARRPEDLRCRVAPSTEVVPGDVLDYLLAALDVAGRESRIFEIGGLAQVSYGDCLIPAA